MNNGLFLQRLKILTYPFSSFYSYRHPDFLEYFILDERNNLSKTNKKENVVRQIFDDVRQGFYTTKLDSVRMIIDNYWKINFYKYKEYSCEDLLYILNKQIAKKYLEFL